MLVAKRSIEQFLNILCQSDCRKRSHVLERCQGRPAISKLSGIANALIDLTDEIKHLLYP